MSRKRDSLFYSYPVIIEERLNNSKGLINFVLDNYFCNSNMSHFLKFLVLSVLVISLIGCKENRKENQQNHLFNLTENTGINFTNKVENNSQFNIFSYRNFYNGGGVAIGDINNDGLADIFFTANMGSNKLYLNKGNWKFEDITSDAGFKNSGKWGTGVVMADINNDGWLDIYVCNAGYQKGIGQENELYINNGLSTSPKK
ncbi:MAG: VCBS repeat-containing protein [Segetibacter sp.]